MSEAQEVLVENKQANMSNCRIASHEWEINYHIEALRLMSVGVHITCLCVGECVQLNSIVTLIRLIQS